MVINQHYVRPLNSRASPISRQSGELLRGGMRRSKRTRDKCDFVQFGAGFVFSFTLDSYWRAFALLPSHPNSLFSPTGSAPLSP
jgi:hypothetical protein